MAGENFGESGAIHQSFTHSDLHLKVVDIRIVDYQEKFTPCLTALGCFCLALNILNTVGCRIKLT